MRLLKRKPFSWIFNNLTVIGNTKQTGSLTKDELRNIREKTEKGQKSEAIVINQSELDRMKATTKIQTKEFEI